MNKLLKYTILVFVILTFVGCTRSVEYSSISTEISKSTKFNEDAISDAINHLKSEFDFEGATLKRIEYDEAKSNNAIEQN